MNRKVASSAQTPLWKAFQDYSRRLVKDLEAKGIIRTAVETLNVATHATDTDILSAECMRTFATVAFPATLLLKREEIETGKVTGNSIISALRHGKGKGRSSFIEAPFDLMYGFRGNSHVVDLLSPFEMLRYWRMERIFPPKEGEKKPTSSWTSAGVTYKTRCKTDKETPQWEAGVHYIALPDADRILLPDLPALSSLRHRCSVELPSNKVHIQFYLPLSPHFENRFMKLQLNFLPDWGTFSNSYAKACSLICHP